jgi:hypothetical protein
MGDEGDDAMPRTTLALKFGLYAPAVIGPLFLALSFAADGLKLSRGGGLQSQLDVTPALLIPSILILSYLAFGLPAFATGVLAAVFGPTIERWEIYQAGCVAVGGVLSGVGYLAFVWLMGALTEQDRVLFWVAAIAGALAAAAGARWTRAEHQEAVRDHLFGPQA